MVPHQSDTSGHCLCHSDLQCHSPCQSDLLCHCDSDQLYHCDQQCHSDLVCHRDLQWPDDFKDIHVKRNNKPSATQVTQKEQISNYRPYYRLASGEIHKSLLSAPCHTTWMIQLPFFAYKTNEISTYCCSSLVIIFNLKKILTNYSCHLYLKFSRLFRNMKYILTTGSTIMTVVNAFINFLLKYFLLSHVNYLPWAYCSKVPMPPVHYLTRLSVKTNRLKAADNGYIQAPMEEVIPALTSLFELSSYKRPAWSCRVNCPASPSKSPEQVLGAAAAHAVPQ